MKWTVLSFSKKPTEAISNSESELESDGQYDDYASDAEKSVNDKKRKQTENRVTTNKKVNRKTTPKSKKK